jgi:hypothetical protein
LLQFRIVQDAAALQSFGPRAVDGNFVGKQSAIERKGILERVEKRVRRFIESATPQAVIFAFGHDSGSCDDLESVCFIRCPISGPRHRGSIEILRNACLR